MGGLANKRARSRIELKDWMKRTKISVDDLAAMLGVVPWTVYAWRRGVAPSRLNATRLSKMSEGAIAMDGWT